jgi:hypothetical protein
MALLRILIVFFGIASLSCAADITLTTLDGKKSTGEVASIDAKELVFKTSSGNETHELTKIAEVEFGGVKDPPTGTKWIEVELIDGSQFRCADFKIKQKTAILTLLGTNQVVEVPATLLLYMVRDLSDPKLNQKFRGMLSKRGKRDVWILLQKNESLDSLEGTFGDGDEKGDFISFEIALTGKKNQVPFTGVYGMIFNQPPGVKVGQTVCKVLDAHKNSLFAQSLTITAKKTFLVETVTGVKVEYPSIAAISKLDFSAGALRYLSNMVPVKVEESSTEGTPEPYRRDRNLDNEEIKIAGVRYAKGLALHSKTMLTYDLRGEYKLFQAVAGVDDCVEGESKATLTIEADFKPIFTQVIKKGDKPVTLNLAVLNVKQLRITVESDFLDLGNQIDLADAKVRK